jgi:hypothetical protein
MFEAIFFNTQTLWVAISAVKGKVYPVHAMNAGVAEVQLHSFLTPALGGGNRSPSRPGRFTPWQEPSYSL